jgi:hypothetical protein
MTVPDFRFIGRVLAMTIRRTRRKRRRRMMPRRRRRCRLRRRSRLRRSRRRRRRDAAAPAARRRSLRRTLPCTSTFRSPLILGGWPAARYTHWQSPCPCLPNPDLMHGSRLAQLVIATTRHAARHRSHRPSSASHHSPWNRRPQPSQRYVMYASTVHGSQLLSLYVCMQARVTRASTELSPAGRAKRVAKVRG